MKVKSESEVAHFTKTSLRLLVTPWTAAKHSIMNHLALNVNSAEVEKLGPKCSLTSIGEK